MNNHMERNKINIPLQVLCRQKKFHLLCFSLYIHRMLNNLEFCCITFPSNYSMKFAR